jgi:creatinine amidohydrolase/Fe(II)-dependent formamide hydrolase-like protein
VRYSFEQFYFLNGHGGNIATVTAALSEIVLRAASPQQRTFRRSNAG